MSHQGSISTWLGIFLLAGCLGTGCSDDVTTTDGGSGKDAAADQAADAGADTKPAARQVVILHTTDMHDHLMGWGPNADYTPGTTGDDKTVGGFARLAALIKKERTAAGQTPVLLLDAGDFMMGTPFTLLGLTHAPTLSLMQRLGYDAITLGNHEFDWTPEALAGIIGTATKGGFKVPLLASNMVFDSSSTGDDKLQQLMTSGVIKKKLVKTLPNGVKVGFFGLLGAAGVSAAWNEKPLTFTAAETVAKAMVKELRETDKVDLVVCLSHSGLNADLQSGDDYDLAKAVPGIDVIISGHTHLTTTQPVKVGKTLIVQSGAYDAQLGKLELLWKGTEVTLKKFSLLALDDQIKGDAAVQTQVEGYIKAVDTAVQPMGLSYNKVLAETAFDLTFPPYVETNLGDLITDAYRAQVDKLTPTDKVHVAVESGGIIRDPISKGKTGKLWFADVFRALPGGIGPDKRPGFPLVAIYLTGAELKRGLELLPVAQEFLKNNDYFLQISGATVEFDKSRPWFQRVSSFKVGGSPISDSACYKLVTTLYVSQMIAVVGQMLPAINLTAKDKGCKNAIKDLTTAVVKDNSGAELKGWVALVRYLQSLKDSDADKIPDLGSEYAKPQGRLVFK
jgi:5'-nucleotidase